VKPLRILVPVLLMLLGMGTASGVLGETVYFDSYTGSRVTEGITGESSKPQAAGQVFEASRSDTLYQAVFRLSKAGTPSGSLFAKIYAITGTYGTDAVPTGSALATSNSVEASSLGSLSGPIAFTFTNTVSLVQGGRYAVVVDVSSATVDGSNPVQIDLDNLGTHSGNYVKDIVGTGWTATGSDAWFAVTAQTLASGSPSEVKQPQVTPEAIVEVLGVPGILGLIGLAVILFRKRGR